MNDLVSERTSSFENTVISSGCLSVEQPQWYALQTRPRHEKRVVSELREKNVVTYLPLLNQLHHWSDRRKLVQVPLFACYVFVYSKLGTDLLAKVYGIWGALGFVGPNRHGVPIPEHQIENVRTLLASNVTVSPYPLLKVGQRVRVRGGTMDGVEGILAANGKRLVISVETISHSLSVSIEGQRVEPV